MPRKTKKHPFQGILQSSGIAAAAIVMVCVSLGALMVPGIFADAGTPSVSNVQATPGGGRNYGVSVTWDGWTRDHWKGETLLGSTTVSQWTTNNKQFSATSLKCGEQYTFKVAAAGPNGGAQSDWKTAKATPTCPTATWISYSRVGNRIDMAWKAGTSFTESYILYISANGGAYTTYTTSGTQYSLNGNCNTLYQAKLKASANGQSGPETAVQSLTTPACPPTSGGGGGGGSSGGGSGGSGPSSGGGGGTTSSGGDGTKSLPITNGATKTLAPSTPQNFSADIASSKVVVLSWDPATNADHYLISRSTDSTTWEEIANTTQTNYKDEGADFSSTYYYQLQAVSKDGQKSSAATTQATTEAFKSTSNTVTSDDRRVTAKIPNGAIDGDYSCTITTSDTEGSEMPKGQSLVLGPYDLVCVTEEGDVVADFDTAIPVTMKLSSVSDGYTNVTARTLKNGTWKTTKAKYDQEKQVMSFSLSGATSFAAFGEKQSSIWGTIGVILLVLLLVGATVFGLIWWRRRAPSSPSAVQSEMTAEQEFRHALAQPDCSHLSMAQRVIPSSAGCYECEQQHTHWNALRICLLCGHVGCSDDSPQQHALKHFQETGHPLIYEYGNPNGNTIGWCYIDQTYI